jgi:hypothetical protein
VIDHEMKEVLEEQIGQIRKKIKTHPDAGLQRSASYFSDRGRRVYRPLHVAVCRRTR